MSGLGESPQSPAEKSLEVPGDPGDGAASEDPMFAQEQEESVPRRPQAGRPLLEETSWRVGTP